MTAQSEGSTVKLVAEAASRNLDALCTLLDRVAPRTGHALELASGTGQHVAEFSRVIPDLTWQPSEIDPQRRASIDAYSEHATNISKAIHLNATHAGWHKVHSGQDLIILINLLHLISWPDAKTLVQEAALALKPGGLFMIYGPFMRNGQLTSEGDRRFHTALRLQPGEIGYKNDKQVSKLLASCGLSLIEVADMPANNLTFVTKKASS